MKINVKNNSTANSTKIDLVKEFLRFCQLNSPLKTSIDIVFVDKSNQVFFDGKYFSMPSKATQMEAAPLPSSLLVRPAKEFCSCMR